MRVSTAQIFDTGTLGIQSNQASLFKLQNQLSTGRRFLTPADDPVAAAQVLVTTQSQSVNQQYLENQKIAGNQLALVDSVLGSVNDELKNIYELAVQAGNGALGSSERAMIATELQTRLDSLVSLANSQDGTGQYLFAGFQSQVQPFSQSGAVAGGPPSFYDLSNTYVQYNGDDGIHKLQVDASQEMALNETGSEVFMRVRDSAGNATGRSVFDAVQNLIVDLQDPASSAGSPTFNQSLGDVLAAVDSVSIARARVGAQLNKLDALQTTASDIDLQHEQRLSELQDLDYAKAISDLMRKKMQLEAALTSFSRTSQLTLFNVI